MNRTLLFSLLIFPVLVNGQTVLYENNFETTSGFNLNTTDEGGSTSATNTWVINDEYAGGSASFTCLGIPVNLTIPPCAQQPSAITNNPTSNYLHVAPQIALDVGLGTCSYVVHDGICINGGNSAFAAMSSGFSTVGYDSVELDLWWICAGHIDYYGEVYYSINGGSNWTGILNPNTFTNQWNMEQLWVNSKVSDPAWTNQSNLRFGFRFYTGTAQSGTFDDPGFGVDEIKVTGFSYADVQETDLDKLLKVYPNPGDGVVNIEIKDFQSNINVSVCNIEGKFVELYQFDNTGTVQVELPEEQGIYILEIEVGDKVQYSKVMRN